MELTKVTLSDISRITHEVFLPRSEPYVIPDFKVIRYTGHYRHGSAGKADARYISATTAAAHEAWFSSGIVLDFTELQYEWGDEMECVFDIGQRSQHNCAFPLVIVVGPECKEGLKSLVPDEYDAFCVESLPDALALLAKKGKEYEECLVNWRKGA